MPVKKQIKEFGESGADQHNFLNKIYHLYRGVNHLKKSHTHSEKVINKVEKSRKKSKSQEECQTV